MANKFQRRKDQAKDIALERIAELFKQADSSSQIRANKYVALARRISSRHKVSIPKELKRKFCKKCGNYWKAGTVRIRLNNGKKTYYCTFCKKYSRIPYK